jgi:hypothetical protein
MSISPITPYLLPTATWLTFTARLSEDEDEDTKATHKKPRLTRIVPRTQCKVHG